MLPVHPAVAAIRRLRLIGVMILCALIVRGGIAVVYDDLPRLFPNFHGIVR
jgi:hypothetical protein